MPANTTRNYWATARLLADKRQLLRRTAWLDEHQADAIHQMYACAFAAMFAADNPRFKTELFMKAANELE
jgi:hypothetical protein